MASYCPPLIEPEVPSDVASPGSDSYIPTPLVAVNLDPSDDEATDLHEPSGAEACTHVAPEFNET